MSHFKPHELPPSVDFPRWEIRAMASRLRGGNAMFRLSNVRQALVLVLVLALAGAVSASDTKGTVRTVKTDKNEIVVKGILNDTTYELTKDARVCLDGKKVKLGELRDGDHVMIEYQKTGDRFIADEVRALRKASETTGTVRSTASDRNHITLKGLVKDSTYQLENGAMVWVNGKHGSLADLREGAHVRVTYEQRGDQLMASEVTLLRKQ